MNEARALGGFESVTDAGTEPMGWARIWATARPFARPMPRAGAWYPVVGEASGERAVLQVRGKRVAILRRLLEVRPQRPDVFTVVVRPREGAGTRAAGGVPIQRIYALPELQPAGARAPATADGAVLHVRTPGRDRVVGDGLNHSSRIRR